MTASLITSFLTFWIIAQTPLDATNTISTQNVIPTSIATPIPEQDPTRSPARIPEQDSSPIPASLTPTIETSVDRNEILIGDVFHLTVTITHDPTIRILQRETGMDLGQFEIKEINPGREEKQEDGKIRQTIDYQLSTFFTGDFEIPAFEIRFQSAEGATGNVKTSPIQIKVRSLTPEESEGLDIREIKEPVLLSGASRMWIVWTILLSLLALAALGYAIWHYYKNRSISRPAVPPLPPHEQAYRSLRELRENPEWREKRDYEYFSTRISEIIRIYIGQRWTIDAIDETTEETLSELQKIALENEVYLKFENFFNDCDLMKFAKYELSPEELDGLIDQAVWIVDATREKPEESQPEFVSNNKPEDNKPDENGKASQDTLSVGEV